MESTNTLLKKVFSIAVWFLTFVVDNCLCDVLIVSPLTNTTIKAYGDLPALFGPPLPLSGFKGLLNYVTPHDACILPQPPPVVQGYNGLWIGLVKRFNCSFVDKVLNAQHAGYDAVIVHNVGSNSIQPMSADHQVDNVVIPSVFIGQDDATDIIEQFQYNKGYTVVITDDLPFNLQNYLIPFAITIGICFVVMLTIMIVKCVRDYRRSRRHRLSSRALKKLPVHKYKKGDPYECCAICLEDYVDNDKLRILPCSHAYHTKCIDPWLTKNRRVCPVCKRKVFTGDERPSDLETDSEDENSPLINSDGGTQGGTFNQQRENPFQEAQRLAEDRRRRRRRRTSSHNVECGPEGYQRLANSTDDEHGEDSDAEKNEQDSGGRTEVEGTGPDDAESAGDDESVQSSHEPPTTVSVIVHGPDRPASRQTDTSSIGSSVSASSHSIPSADPGPVQIAVDIINSPQPTVHSSEGLGHDRDYVV